MADKLDILYDYLMANPVDDMGEIFVHEMPEDSKHGVLLMGTLYGTDFNAYMPKYKDAELRIIVRSASTERAKNLAYRLMNERLIRYDQFRVGDVLVKKLLPLTEPHPFRHSKGGYVEYEIEQAITYVIP